MQREAAAYVKLRRVGLSINAIAKAFGRSTSVVHRYVTLNVRRGILRRFDMRKLPYQARMRMASFRWALMLKLRDAWERFMCGEGEKPP